jgi:leucyl-tRNA synthetase
VYDPKTDTYLTLKWKKYPWTTFVVGGVEEGEDSRSAVLREIEEETGYTNLVFKKVLGGIVCSEYFAAHKDENRFARVQGYLFELGPNTEHSTPSAQELEKHEVTWMTLKEFEADANMTCTEYVFWKELISKDVVFTGEGLLLHSGTFDGMVSKEAKKKIVQAVGGEETKQYRIRDWLLSRQRYWGCPIPVVYDPEGTPHAIPDEYLPWTLPDDVDFTPTGEAPLAQSESLKKRTEELFGKGWTPEVDTMDTFVDSSWYFLRYIDPHNETSFSTLEKQKLWMPVDRYSGGAEHTTMHVLYSRFFQKALFDMGLVTENEPYKRRMNRGLILGPDGLKMSKSKGNVIDPDEQVTRVGADTVKTYLAFIGPYNEVGQYPWDIGGMVGVRRFYERIWGLFEQVSSDAKESQEVTLLLHQTIKKVGEDTESYKFNTAISQLMILVNLLEKEEHLKKETYDTILKMLAPFAPHLTEELWEMTGHSTSVHKETWPDFDEEILRSAQVTVAVQVNGKTRGTFTVAPNTAEEELVAIAKTLETVTAHMANKRIVREIIVPNRLVNFVVDVG